jgi:hypothetical protein
MLFWSCLSQDQKVNQLRQLEKKIDPVASNSFELNILNYCTNLADIHADYFIIKENLVPTRDGYFLDTDGDGVADTEEDAKNESLGITRDSKYSNNHELSDLVINVLNVNKNEQDKILCTNTGDSNGDGLNDCEKQYLGLDSANWDFDKDGIPDLVELRQGLNPTIHDSFLDSDGDGILNIDEVRVNAPINDRQTDQSIYENVRFVDRSSASSSVNCYDIKIENLVFVSTLEFNTYSFFLITSGNGVKKLNKHFQLKVNSQAIKANQNKMNFLYDDLKGGI